MKFGKVVKTVAVASAMLVMAVGLTACGKKSADTGSYEPKKLVVEFKPSSNAGSADSQVKPLEKLLTKQLHVPVKVVMQTSGSSMVEALGSKTADVAFLSPADYVLAHKNYQVKPLLQGTRFKYDDNENHTSKTSDTFISEVVVKKDSGINSLKDLKGKKIATQDATSTAGYIYPAVEMNEQGINLHKNGIKTFTVKGHDQAVMAVENGNADAAFCFEGARKIASKDDPKIMENTKVIYKTKPIPNDAIAVRSDMSAKWDTKITDAFQNIAKSKEGHDILNSLYGYEGFAKINDKDFNGVRKNLEDVKKIDK
ncbi:phosphate/phosphite/phosphonate ABC transporter substrate-binding protein [Fructilactobacillus frigidiflavus]|uniref:phosphate/phosphite/phosphonate ABC transporter substrate-binding protein n=1 Tax=Fructilactobacillus frigidiflavus TaxID=3242688 RepID=UPI003756E90B